jgi:hypothetical protein
MKITSPHEGQLWQLAVATLGSQDLEQLVAELLKSHVRTRSVNMCFAASAIVLCPERIGFQRLFQRVVKRAEFVEGRAPLVRWLSSFGRSDPFSDGVSRYPGTLGDLVQRELVAEVHPPDFSQHFHADHPVFCCSKSEQKQLNTWVSFRSAATGIHLAGSWCPVL